MTCCIPVMWSFSCRHHGMVTCMWVSDRMLLIWGIKHRKPMFPQEERLFMIKNIKAVKDAYNNEGSGVSEDMAGEVAEDGFGDARPTGILFREQSGAS